MQSIRNNNNFFPWVVVNGSDMFVIHFHNINDINDNNINVYISFLIIHSTHVDLVYYEMLHQFLRQGRL